MQKINKKYLQMHINLLNLSKSHIIKSINSKTRHHNDVHRRQQLTTKKFAIPYCAK